MKIPENTIINGDIFWDSSVLKSLKAAPGRRRHTGVVRGRPRIFL